MEKNIVSMEGNGGMLAYTHVHTHAHALTHTQISITPLIKSINRHRQAEQSHQELYLNIVTAMVVMVLTKKVVFHID